MYTVSGVGKGNVLCTASAQIADSTEYAYSTEAGDSDEDDLDCGWSEGVKKYVNCQHSEH